MVTSWNEWMSFWVDGSGKGDGIAGEKEVTNRTEKLLQTLWSMLGNLREQSSGLIIKLMIYICCTLG